MLLITRDEKILMRDDLGVAGLEKPPLLRGLPAVHLARGDALAGHVLVVIDPDELAVIIEVGLLESVQIGLNIVGAGVGVSDAVKVVCLDKLHQLKLAVDLLIYEGLHCQLNIAGGKFAGGLFGYRDGHGDLDGLLAGHRAQDLDARGVVHIKGLDDVGVAALDGDGVILTVDLEIARCGEIYTAGGDVCGVDPIAGHVVGQAGILETCVKLRLKQLGYILRVGVALDADGEFLRHGNAVDAAADERCGERDILIELAGDDSGVIRGVVRIVRRGADFYDGAVRGGPRHGAPRVER